MIRKILVPIRGDGKGDNVFAHAAALARRFKAHIVVTHCRPRPEDLLPYGVPVPSFLRKQLLEQSGGLADVEAEKLKAEFTELAASSELKLTDKPDGKSASASWIEEAGRQVDIIKRHGRLADLIAVAQPDVDRNLGANTLKAALFSTGRPVLMCPPQDSPPQSLGENLALAWNGSTEAARAVALTKDLLEAAQSVTVLTTGDQIHGATSQDLLAYLDIRGVKASLHAFEATRRIGADLLKHAAEAGADTMIMGAYGDSHEAETVFGGNTQTVVDGAKMPVIMVH